MSLLLVIIFQTHPVVAQLSTSNPLGFFTNLSSRLLQSEFGLNLNQIRVYPTNQYTPAVHRLLQVAANVWETQTNSEAGLPTVFRPRFGVTNLAVCISGYVFVTNDSELASLPLLDLTASTNVSALVPPDGNALVFGVPLVVGARKGLPNFNEFAMESVFQLTRKLELRKSSLGGAEKINQTNQLFVLTVTMPWGVEFWNSYASNYTRPVNIYVTNHCSATMTNDSGVLFITNFVVGAFLQSTNWPRFQEVSPNPTSFLVPLRINSTILPLTGYRPSLPGNTGFVSPVSNSYDTDQTFLMPRWGLTITNRIHAKIVDQITGRIIDYVLLGNMTSHRNLTDEFVVPTTGTGDPFQILWATNTLPLGRLSGRPGVIQQIRISRGIEGGVDLSSLQWTSYGAFSPNNVSAAVAGFNQFFQPNSTSLVTTVPFSPIIQLAMPMIWQVNDPLVHSFPSELFNVAESGLIRWIIPPGILSSNTPSNIGHKNRRYHPWGKYPSDLETDPDAFNATIIDPLVRSSEDWNFPTNATLTIESLGRIHRGTPWQTLYLKSSDLGLTNIVKNPAEWVGNYSYLPAAIKWADWAGIAILSDGFYTRPVRDWSLVALIASMMNTNDPRQLISINDLNQTNWLMTFNGLSALTNTTTESQLLSGNPAQFQTLPLSSNSPQVLLLVQGIATVRANQSGTVFRNVGELLVTPTLSLSSPWLNQNSDFQIQRGITDEAYEKIPAQLLSRVRADSIGSVLQYGATWQIQFSGFDNYPYAVECSTNLILWTSVSTHYPTNGVFTFTDSSGGAWGKRFYRSVLLP